MLTELFLAGRYLKPKRNAVSLITLSSIIGVMLGVAVLIVVLAVMSGFTELMKQKLIETQSHFQVRSVFGNYVIENPAPVVAAIKRHGGQAAPVLQSPILLQIKRNLDPRMMVFGINPDDFTNVLPIGKMLLSGKLSLEKNEIVISDDLSKRWNLKVGDKILLHSPQKLTSLVDFKPGGGVELNKKSSAYLPGEFKITGIYSTGKYDFDRSVVFIGLEDAAELLDLPWGSASSVFGWGDDPFHQKPLIDSLKKDLPNYRVSTWEEENSQLLGVLNVEKRMMFFLLIFIVLVAAFSITNTLITSVYQKTREIGILKSLGASDMAVSSIFVLQGFLVGVIGSVAGTGLGVLIIHFRNDIMHAVSKITGQPLFPKEFYYFNELPAKIIPFPDVTLIVVSAIVLCTLGALLPALRAARLDPARALRYE